MEQNEGQGEKKCGLAFVWPLSGLGQGQVWHLIGPWSVLGQALVGPWLGLFDRGNLLWKSNV